MKIALVSEHASPLAVRRGAGAAAQHVHVAGLATALGRLGHEVVVHTRRDDPSLPAREELVPGVEVAHVDAGPARSVPEGEVLAHLGELREGLRLAWEADPPDIVHAHAWTSGVAALGAARPLGIPIVETFHTLGSVERRHRGAADASPADRLATERMLVARTDCVVATCSEEALELVTLGAHLDRIRIVPCGVDLDLFRPDGAKEPRRNGRHRLLAVGRLDERKGLAEVLTALASVPDTELLVAGGADADIERLRRLAESSGVADRVEFRGHVAHDRLPALVRSADVVVSVPWYEPFGTVPLEAMACGIPVVASAVGGQVDTVVDGHTGLHVPPRRPDALARALNGLLADPARRRSMGAAGVQRARRVYGWRRVAAEMVAAYDETLGTRDSRRRPTPV